MNKEVTKIFKVINKDHLERKMSVISIKWSIWSRKLVINVSLERKKRVSSYREKPRTFSPPINWHRPASRHYPSLYTMKSRYCKLTVVLCVVLREKDDKMTLLSSHTTLPPRYPVLWNLVTQHYLLSKSLGTILNTLVHINDTKRWL